MFKNRILPPSRVIALLLGLACLGATAAAQMPASTSPSFKAGTLTVQQYGSQGEPVILIPGLASGAWVWDNTVAHLAATHVVYTVALAGFDGIPAPTGDANLMDSADSSLLALITTRHMARPVIIGHSLGGTLAIRFATEHSNLLSGAIAVDGLPIFPGAEHMTPEQRAAGAKNLSAAMASATPEQFSAQQLGYMQRIGVLNADTAAKYAAFTGRSDPVATGTYAAEDFMLDLRPELKNITVPLLEISPYNTADFSMPPMAMSEAQKTAYYEQLLSGVPNCKVVSISPSRHFVMLDQPARFLSVVKDFLAAHK